MIVSFIPGFILPRDGNFMPGRCPNAKPHIHTFSASLLFPGLTHMLFIGSVELQSLLKVPLVPRFLAPRLLPFWILKRSTYWYFNLLAKVKENLSYTNTAVLISQPKNGIMNDTKLWDHYKTICCQEYSFLTCVM
mgnify:CR=1 FL=1